MLCLLVACGGEPPAAKRVERPKQARTESAAERAHREYAASKEGKLEAKGKKWGGWRYAGARDDCFFVVGRRCFTDRADACKAARCKKRQRCSVVGGGPAQVSCK